MAFPCVKATLLLAWAMLPPCLCKKIGLKILMLPKDFKLGVVLN